MATSARFSQVFSLYFQRHLKRRSHLLFATLALVLLLVDSYYSSVLNPVRRTIDNIFQPFDTVVEYGSSGLVATIDFISRLQNQAEELAFLREENENLRLWRQYAQALEIENRQLNSHFTTISNGLGNEIRHFRITKRIPSAQRLELASEDTENLPDFAAVISSNSLIGRLLSEETEDSQDGKKSKSIMLLSHPDSRVPVQVGHRGIQAILIGQGNDLAKLEYQQQNFARLAIGDVVVSSRFLSYLPSGLAIGTVVGLDQENITVKLGYDLDLLRYIGVILPKTGLQP